MDLKGRRDELAKQHADLLARHQQLLLQGQQLERDIAVLSGRHAEIEDLIAQEEPDANVQG